MNMQEEGKKPQNSDNINGVETGMSGESIKSHIHSKATVVLKAVPNSRSSLSGSTLKPSTDQ